MTAFVLHEWKECPRRVYFMKFRRAFINIRKKAEETGETKEEMRTREKRRRKIVGGTSYFNIFMDGTLRF